MIRTPTIRRFIIALFFFMGALTQFQTLYACELMEDERPSVVCCCDELNDTGPMGCEMGGGCQDQSGLMSDGCCNLSYEPSQVAQTAGSQSQQILMLDAAQPPPLRVSFDFPEIIPVNHAVYFAPDSSSPPNKPVYFLTSRFLI